MKKINENTKVTLTFGQLKKLVKEAVNGTVEKAYLLDDVPVKEDEQPAKVATIELPQDLIDKWDHLLELDPEEVDFEKEDIDEDSTLLRKTVKFDDGFEGEVKVCSGQEGALWAESVLFTPDGDEVTCTEPGVALSGEYDLQCKNGQYVIMVVGK